MPCQHKFADDLQLQYADWELKTLFIGTFNPDWNVCANNYAQWFYGRTQRNSFWCILPTLHSYPSLINGNRDLWMDFCRKNQIGITDILFSVDADIQLLNHQQAICSFKDDALSAFNVTVNNIPAILAERPEIKQICITRMELPDFWVNCFAATLQFIANNPGRNIQLIYLRSPSRLARRGVVGNFCEFVANTWLQQGYQTNPN